MPIEHLFSVGDYRLQQFDFLSRKLWKLLHWTKVYFDQRDYNTIAKPGTSVLALKLEPETVSAQINQQKRHNFQKPKPLEDET
jgi:hypothetical protein